MVRRQLTAAVFSRVSEFMLTQARDIERHRFQWEFLNHSPHNYVESLAKYQNADGGFAYGIESDFHLPLSTPMATSVGLRYLHAVPNTLKPEIVAIKHLMIENALHWLIPSFDIDRRGWPAVRSEVNDYPHAPWWNWDPATKQTVIDNSWGNPSAELMGYYIQYRELLPEKQYQDFIDATTDYALRQLEGKTEFHSEHEIYCYLRLFKALSQNQQNRIRPRLTAAIRQLMVVDPAQWGKYVPMPLHFLQHPSDNQFEISKDILDKNLDYQLDRLESDALISPSWDWGEDGEYGSFWDTAKVHWTGVLTLRALQVLRNFGYLNLSDF
ncbi:MAG: hypothetical protein E4G98_04070 [Promethearchaeota archaeon]|nr:MAG: hypothetical protein E4G98_04070 [Candidatus Lokiarchaeota archaeon]